VLDSNRLHVKDTCCEISSETASFQSYLEDFVRFQFYESKISIDIQILYDPISNQGSFCSEYHPLTSR
jgi:hypothetical protein